jgi:hypothetical protein
MNFFSAERFSSALQAVGNIIAPLPEDYANEAPAESPELQYDGSSQSIGEEQQDEEDPVKFVDKVTEKVEDNYSQESRGINEQEYQLSTDPEEHDWRVESLLSQSPTREIHPTHHFVDSDTESDHSEDLSPLPSPQLKVLDEPPLPSLVSSRPSPTTEVTPSSESLQEELVRCKSKIASTFSEISSLSDSLRESIAQNRDLERRLELERETQRLMSSRIQALSESKETLVLQLSEVLEAREKERSADQEKEMQRRKESEAQRGLLERYQLVVEEKGRLTEALSEMERKAHSDLLERQQTVDRSATLLLEEIGRLVSGPSESVSPQPLTAQSLNSLVSTAIGQLRSFASQLARDKEAHRLLTEQFQHTEARLATVMERAEECQRETHDLQLQLSEQLSRYSVLEERLRDVGRESEEQLKSCRLELERSEQRVRTLEERDHRKADDDQSESTSGSLLESTSAEMSSLRSQCEELSRQLALSQQEKDTFWEFYRSCVASAGSYSLPTSSSKSLLQVNGSNSSLLPSLEALHQLWKALELALNESQSSQVGAKQAKESLLTEHQAALKTIDQLTREKDELQIALRDLRSSEALRKQAMSESKAKIDELFKKILEMKQTKEENDALKQNLERLSAESKRELVR